MTLVLDHDLLAPSVDARRVSALSPRETDVMRLIAGGSSNVGIARELFLSNRTVETHITHLFDKLGLPDGPEHNRRVLTALLWAATSPHPAPARPRLWA